jgi:hypothetical protein
MRTQNVLAHAGSQKRKEQKAKLNRATSIP